MRLNVTFSKLEYFVYEVNNLPQSNNEVILISMCFIDYQFDDSPQNRKIEAKVIWFSFTFVCSTS